VRRRTAPRARRVMIILFSYRVWYFYDRPRCRVYFPCFLWVSVVFTIASKHEIVGRRRGTWDNNRATGGVARSDASTIKITACVRGKRDDETHDRCPRRRRPLWTVRTRRRVVMPTSLFRVTVVP